MKKYILSAAVAIAAISISCKQVDNAIHPADSTVTLAIDILGAEPLDDDVYATDSIILVGDANSIPGIIIDVAISGDTLFLCDPIKAHGLFLYDTKGNYISSIGEIGQGPDEVLDYTDFCLANAHVYILDNPGHKIVKYDKGGKCITKFDIKPAVMNFAMDENEGMWLDRGNSGVYKDDRFNDKLCHIKNGTSTTLLSLPENLEGLTISPRSNFQELADGTISYMPSMQPEIYSLKNENIGLKYILDFGEYWPSPELLNTLKDKDIYSKVNALMKKDLVMNLSFTENEYWLALNFTVKDKYYVYVFNKSMSVGKLFLDKSHRLYYPILINGNNMFIATGTDGTIMVYDLSTLF